ncbi:MAG: hypothetical protein IPG99_20185 [Ignavibacteria bacterium]|nr:hypothetical protein [Ignavibacteria bacterium]
MQDKKVKILWREDYYNAELQDTMSMIVMNSSYCSTLPDPEKAAIAFVATFVGNDCWWDGQYTNDRSNLKCKVLTELNLGYQCSESHLGFLRHWFREDAKALERLEDCPTTPFTATEQETFDSISIGQRSFGNVFFSVNCSYHSPHQLIVLSDCASHKITSQQKFSLPKHSFAISTNVA